MSGEQIHARAEILERLRSACGADARLFRTDVVAGTKPEPPAPVTQAEGGRHTLATTFGRNLEAVAGTYEIVERFADVAGRIRAKIVRWQSEGGGAVGERESDAIEVLSWAPSELPIPNLVEYLREAGITLVVPDDLHDDEWRRRAAGAMTGVTGVDAAFASTGSVAIASGVGRSRAASLLPLHHIALIPLSKIQPTFEAWLHTLRASGRLADYLCRSCQLVFVTGPSKSADIELSLTLGVHGPRDVHAILFDDSQ